MLDVDPNSLKFNFARATVVVIDHNALSLDLLTGILGGFGFRGVHRFTELAPAVRCARASSADLILIDPQAFGEEAFDFIRGLRAAPGGQNAKTPVMIVSGHTSLRMLKQTRDCGADYVIAKPFSTAVLLERILWVATAESRQPVLIEEEAPVQFETGPMMAQGAMR